VKTKKNKPSIFLESKTPYSYGIYHDFVETYLPSGFLNINDKDPIMQHLESLMELNDQLLIAMDLTALKIVFTSKRSMDMLGIEPAHNSTMEMLNRVHPDDLYRFGMGRAKLLSMDKDMLVSHKGSALLSTNIRMKKPDGKYANHLFQCYLFYSPLPHEAVYYIQVNTNIDSFKMKKGQFHYYVGNDTNMFRFPDEELLSQGHQLTIREFEIIKLIASGKNSGEIADELFISLNTVNTHRRNILEKTSKGHISDVIFDLMKQGLL
jgi:DNA-binding CsgD family transcriptional regulator